MDEKQLVTILEIIENKNEEIESILDKIKNNIQINSSEAEKIVIPLKKYFNKAINTTENEIEKEYGYGAKKGISSHQNAYKSMKKALVLTKEYYNDIIKSIEKLII